MLPKPSLEQERLLEKIRKISWVKISKTVEAAFLKHPRHKFIRKFSVDSEHWINVDENSVINYLPIIYSDTTLLLWDKNQNISTISQPSLVLHMLELLDVHEGMRVVELGTGSGWNAAMLSYLVGEKGEVITYEIIPELALLAREILKSIPNIKVKEGDAAALISQEDQFDRGVFTAGAYDLPLIFFDKILEGGKLLLVLKTRSDDLLLCLEKKTFHFEEVSRMRCRFVPVVGEGNPKGEIQLDNLPEKILIYPKGQEQGREVFLHGETCSYVV